MKGSVEENREVKDTGNMADDERRNRRKIEKIVWTDVNGRVIVPARSKEERKGWISIA